jgi:hypothetical protein
VDEGVLEPLWTVGPILPPSLVEVLAQKAESEEQEALEKETDYADKNSETVDEEEEIEIEEIDFEDLFSDDDDDGDE